jgi:RNA polymerase sigma factor (sigma-70 family)
MAYNYDWMITDNPYAQIGSGSRTRREHGVTVVDGEALGEEGDFGHLPRDLPDGSSTTLNDIHLPERKNWFVATWRLAWSIARRYMANHHDREDLAGELVLHVWERRHRFKPGSRFSTWAMAVMTNKAKDLAKAARTLKRSARHVSLEAMGEAAPAVQDRVDEVIDLSRAMSLLPPKERMVMVCDLNGWPLRDTGISNPRVYRRMAHEKLRLLLADGYLP